MMPSLFRAFHIILNRAISSTITCNYSRLYLRPRIEISIITRKITRWNQSLLIFPSHMLTFRSISLLAVNWKHISKQDFSILVLNLLLVFCSFNCRLGLPNWHQLLSLHNFSLYMNRRKLIMNLLILCKFFI